MEKITTGSFEDSFNESVINANKEIYKYIKNELTFKDYQYSNTVGFGGDNSLNIDLITEKIFIKYLSKFGNIYSEECGLLSNDKDYTIVIDPLDGSNNFLTSLPYYGTSVALKKGEKVVAGFVANLVNAVITYRAFDGEVKYFCLNRNKHIDNLTFSKSKVAIFERAYKFPSICKKLHKEKIKFRCLGAVALSLCDARNYEFVLFAGKIREFDIAAALYICEELFIYRTDKYLLISKNNENFNQVKEIIKED